MPTLHLHRYFVKCKRRPRADRDQSILSRGPKQPADDVPSRPWYLPRGASFSTPGSAATRRPVFDRNPLSPPRRGLLVALLVGLAFLREPGVRPAQSGAAGPAPAPALPADVGRAAASLSPSPPASPRNKAPPLAGSAKRSTSRPGRRRRLVNLDAAARVRRAALSCAQDPRKLMKLFPV